MFLLSAFTAHEDGIGILTRTVKSSLREKVYNMVKNAPSKSWSPDDVAARLYMSRSTLKRKLAIEQTSFSEIYLDAGMCMAARLLRTGDYNITQVSVMCGYNHTSYFITTFKKYFQMTPYTFYESGKPLKVRFTINTMANVNLVELSSSRPLTFPFLK